MSAAWRKQGELSEYRRIEKNMQDAIYVRFLGQIPSDEEMSHITDIDNACLYYEFDHYMGEKLMEQAPLLVTDPAFETLPFAQVEQEFLDLFATLTV